MIHNQITSKRGTVHYWISRSKENCKTIVFTHGLTADHTMFEKQVEFFKEDYNIITWDVPLHGLSTPYQNCSYKNTAKELCSILDKEKIQDVLLVGMSMGGYPSQMFGYMYPERTLGFVAIDTTPFGTAYYSKADLFWLKQAAPMANLFSEKLLKRSIAKANGLTEYSFQIMEKIHSTQTKESIIKQMDIAYAKFPQENFDMAMTFPVLLLLGDKDKTGKVKEYNYKWSKKTGYPLVMIENAAHFSNGDNPKQVNNEILRFIESI